MFIHAPNYKDQTCTNDLMHIFDFQFPFNYIAPNQIQGPILSAARLKLLCDPKNDKANIRKSHMVMGEHTSNKTRFGGGVSNTASRGATRKRREKKIRIETQGPNTSNRRKNED